MNEIKTEEIFNEEIKRMNSEIIEKIDEKVIEKIPNINSLFKKEASALNKISNLASTTNPDLIGKSVEKSKQMEEKVENISQRKNSLINNNLNEKQKR